MVYTAQAYSQMVAIEERLGFSLPDGPKNVDSLATILELIMKHEIGHKFIDAQRRCRSSHFRYREAQPDSTKVAQLDDVDRNLIQQLSKGLWILWKEKLMALRLKEWQLTEAERRKW